MKDDEIYTIIDAVLKDARLQKTVVAIVKEFIAAKQKQAAQHNAAKDWHTISDSALRQAYHYRRRKGKDIEPELAAEMARRCKGFDGEQCRFTHRGRMPAAPNPYKELSNDELMAQYNQMVQNGEKINDNMHKELKRRFRRYDAENRTFKDNRRGKQIKQTSELADTTIKGKYYAMRRNGQEIPTDLATEMERRFPGHDTGTSNELGVTTKLLKITQDGAFYDVYVNGKRILHNNVDTKITTFLDGTLLGVYGIATDITEIPAKPSWQIYDTNMTRRRFDRKDIYNQKNIYIRSANETSDGQLRLNVSNNMYVFINKKDLGRVFKILAEKTKQK